MAARDRFEITITCPKCGATSDANVSEDDYPFMRSPRFSVDGIDKGFKVVKRAETRQQTAVQCDCGETFSL